MQGLPALTAKIKSLDEKKAVLTLSDGQELTVPANNLPAQTNQGDEIILKLIDPQTKTEKTDEQARQLLNQILKPDG